MFWRRTDDKPVTEVMMAIVLVHVCHIPPQWVEGNCVVHYVIHYLSHVYQIAGFTAVLAQ